MRVDLIATYPHYAAHLAPIWAALPEDVRGHRYLGAPILRDHTPGSAAPDVRPMRDARKSRNVALVAGMNDAHNARGPIIMTEHGVGQSYHGDTVSTAANNSSYAGGRGRGRIGAFLHPNHYAANLDAAAYPHAMVRVIGSPYLAHLRATITPAVTDRPVVAIAGHWPAGVCAETTSGWGEFHAGFAALADDPDITVIGHGHPRIMRALTPHYARMGVPVVPTLEETLAWCDVFIADNTSAMFYAAALGRGVVVLDSRNYRRHINHGGRFWDWAGIGPRIGDVDAMPAAVTTAYERRPWPGADDILADVFPDVGDPIANAVDAVCEFAAAQDPVPR
jgi:hypothetical protein